MDVHCLNCNEPWDTYHLRHDAIYDAIFDGGLWPEVRRQLLDTEIPAANLIKRHWPDGKLTPEIREAFSRIGWEFGVSLFLVKHCPACKVNGPARNEELKAKAEGLEAVLSTDPDGLATELSELI